MSKTQYIIAAAAVTLLVSGSLGWLGYRNRALTKELSARTQELADLEHEKGELTDALTNAQSTIAGFEGRVGELASTVGTLVKLHETDPELLQKYSKVYFLNDNYIPRDLETINDEFVLEPEKDLEFITKAIPKLYGMLDDARDEGLDLYIASAFRSFEEQNQLKAAYKVTYGAGTANSFSADQGYSEHQLGTTVDFTTKTIGGGLSGFDKTREYQWLLNNAHDYGFVLSYPKGNAYYIFEPWHWRFVGVSLATWLHDDGKYFIELDQREIDPYLVTMFD